MDEPKGEAAPPAGRTDRGEVLVQSGGYTFALPPGAAPAPPHGALPAPSAPAAHSCAGSYACALCSKPICGQCVSYANRQRVCAGCFSQIAREMTDTMAAERPDTTTLPRAVAGGAAGALLGGVAWALFGIATSAELGYLAVAVGFLAGKGVVVATGGKKGQVLQIVAAACSVVGLVAGKYLLIAHYVMEHVAKERGPEAAARLHYYTLQLVSWSLGVLPQTVSPFDALWVYLALLVAWRATAASQFRITTVPR